MDCLIELLQKLDYILKNYQSQSKLIDLHFNLAALLAIRVSKKNIKNKVQSLALTHIDSKLFNNVHNNPKVDLKL